jgi:hypothetical protein
MNKLTRNDDNNRGDKYPLPLPPFSWSRVDWGAVVGTLLIIVSAVIMLTVIYRLATSDFMMSLYLMKGWK